MTDTRRSESAIEAVNAVADLLDHAAVTNREALVSHLRDLVGGLLAERAMLRNECWMLAAPAAMAAHGTSASAVHHIRTYVTQLERLVSELSDRVAELSDDEAEVAEHRRRAEQHRAYVDWRRQQGH